MKPRTVENLTDSLAEDLVWRRKELSAIRQMLLSSTHNLDRQQALLRGGLTLLYAHWEGFVRFAGRTYLEFVRLQRLRYEELSANFLAIAARARLRSGSEQRRIGPHVELARFFLTGLAERAVLPLKDAISTRSNLSSDVLLEIVEVLGLDPTPYSTKAVLIDTRLLATRNTVAHGQYLIIDLAAFEEVYREVIAMMDELRTQIENGAVIGRFKAA